MADKCLVCGAEGAGFHYNGLVCSCCRVFFIRETKRKKKAECRGQGNCVMLPGAADNCRYCRYKRCLAANMKPDVVGQQKYTKRSDSWKTKRRRIVKNESNIEEGIKNLQLFDACPQLPPGVYSPRSIVNSCNSAGFMFLNCLERSQTATEYCQHLLALQRYCDNPEGVQAYEVYANIDVPLTDVLLNSQACSSRAAAVYDRWSLESSSTDENFSLRSLFCRMATQYVDFLTASPEIHYLIQADKVQYDVKSSYCRAVSQYADFITAATELFSLEERDKMRLIQANYADVYYLGCIYELWKSGESRIDLRSVRFKLSPDQQAELTNMYQKLGAYFLQLAPILTDLQISSEEVVLLRFIALFSPPIGLTENGRLIVSQARRKYTQILSGFIRESKPSLSHEEHILRIQRLLRVLRLVRDAAYFISQLCLSFASTSRGNLKGQLTFDLHLRQY